MGIGGILRGSVHLEISLLWPSPLLARVLLCEVQRPQRHDGGGGGGPLVGKPCLSGWSRAQTLEQLFFIPAGVCKQV